MERKTHCEEDENRAAWSAAHKVCWGKGAGGEFSDSAS